MRILIFGDSITYGAWDKEGGWVQRLRKFLDEKTLADNGHFSVYNLGISGDNTEDLLERVEAETRHRLKEKEKMVFVFAIGVNDSQFIHSKNNLRVIPEEFENNIRDLINISKQFSSKIIFIGLTSVDESKTTPIPWNTDKSYKNEYIKKYDDIIKKVCEENKINHVRVFDKLKIADFEDGLHPNSAGHQKIFEIVKKFLIDNKII